MYSGDRLPEVAADFESLDSPLWQSSASANRPDVAHFPLSAFWYREGRIDIIRK
jgi:hypothetical protein